MSDWDANAFMDQGCSPCANMSGVGPSSPSYGVHPYLPRLTEPTAQGAAPKGKGGTSTHVDAQLAKEGRELRAAAKFLLIVPRLPNEASPWVFVLLERRHYNEDAKDLL